MAYSEIPHNANLTFIKMQKKVLQILYTVRINWGRFFVCVLRMTYFDHTVHVSVSECLFSISRDSIPRPAPLPISAARLPALSISRA